MWELAKICSLLFTQVISSRNNLLKLNLLYYQWLQLFVFHYLLRLLSTDQPTVSPFDCVWAWHLGISWPQQSSSLVFAFTFWPVGLSATPALCHEYIMSTLRAAQELEWVVQRAYCASHGDAESRYYQNEMSRELCPTGNGLLTWKYLQECSGQRHRAMMIRMIPGFTHGKTQHSHYHTECYRAWLLRERA